jgi:hypothetical protein
MTEVIVPEAFNEQFTIYLNADGKPVQRALREMTADEVVAAVTWSHAEAKRLEREAAPWQELMAAAADDHLGELADKTLSELEAAILVLRKAAEANEKHGRLLNSIQAAMPKWHQHPHVGAREALRRWWPGGRRKVA